MSHSLEPGAAVEKKQKPTPKIWPKKNPPLNQGRVSDVCDVVSVSLPTGGFSHLESLPPSTPLKLAGLAMVASLLWESRRAGKDGVFTMRLVKAVALQFVDRVGTCSNPTTSVAQAWGCEQATWGSNRNGKVTNTCDELTT